MPNKPGRPPILDDAKRKQICAILQVGGTIATAADVVRCCPRTVYNTARRDPEFKADMDRARALRRVTLLQRMEAASADPRYWRATAWLLERECPEKYAKPQPETVPVGDLKDISRMFLDIVEPEISDRSAFARIADRVQEILYKNFFRIPDNIEAALAYTTQHDLVPFSSA